MTSRCMLKNIILVMSCLVYIPSDANSDLNIQLFNDNQASELFNNDQSITDIKLPDIGSSASVILSPQQEEQIGRSIIKQLKSSLNLIEDTEINDYIVNLGLKLLAHSENSYQNFHFFLLNSSQINAFATPGGVVAIYSGLFLTTESESELASVLAHEIAHVTQQHIARAIEKAKKMNLPITLGLVAAILLGASTSSDVGIAAVSGINAYAYQQQINFTREHEIEADSVGIQILYRSGLNPYGMSGFFQKLQDQNLYLDDVLPEFLRTHPITSERLSDSASRAKLYAKGNSYLKETDSSYKLLKAKLDVLISKNPLLTQQKYKHLQEKNNLLRKPEYHFAYAYSLYKNQHLDLSIKKYKALLAAYPNEIYYITGISQALTTMATTSSINQALVYLKTFLKKHPYHKVLNIRYAEALLLAKQYKKVENLIKSYFQYSSTYPIFHQLLSKAYNRLKKPVLSSISYADYFYYSHELEQAKTQLEIARKLALDDFYLLSIIDAKYLKVKREIKQAKMDKSI